MGNLVLSRRTGERVLIQLPGGLTLTVSVLQAADGMARLGFVAPEEVRIWREELLHDLPPPTATETG